VLDSSAGTAELFHATVSNVILSQRILAPKFRLSDLKFGAEEAERDELLDESFVPRPSTEAILDQRRSIIVGDRGSGKSAIFRKISRSASATDDHPRVEIRAVTSTGDLLHRIVEKDAWLDTDELRAAWLIVGFRDRSSGLIPRLRAPITRVLSQRPLAEHDRARPGHDARIRSLSRYKQLSRTSSHNSSGSASRVSTASILAACAGSLANGVTEASIAVSPFGSSPG
jgi:hypothetical protein